MPDGKEIRANLLAWLMVALFSALPALGLWLCRSGTRCLLPPRRRRAVPWSGFEVSFAFVFTELLLPAFLYELLNKTGFFNWLFDGAPGAADGDLADVRRRLWVSALCVSVPVRRHAHPPPRPQRHAALSAGTHDLGCRPQYGERLVRVAPAHAACARLAHLGRLGLPNLGRRATRRTHLDPARAGTADAH